MAIAGEPSERAPRFAIVGYAARLPGSADADQYWGLLHDGRDAVSDVPRDRWDADEFFDPDPAAPGKVVTRRAGFVDDVSGFDAPFFGISAREATWMDPQHRLLLETAWRAVEHSGTAPTSLANTRTGVFVGLSTHDYLGMASDALTYPQIEAYMAIGTAAAAGAGRISYRLGLHGPAVTVDTACSSSLVAIHQACQALRLGECDFALAGGANVLLSPATMITFSHSRMLAPDGRCKTFDAAADGYVRGEGCGVIAIKRLEDAIRDGDRIRAVIRGSAVNSDGASGGLTVPNGVAQQRVLTEALERADVAPADIDYLEAHGTGTSLGDPIEVQAAAAALGRGRDAGRPLLIGSAKTNIGHLEAAAGVAGVLKVVLALEHQELPKHLNFRTPSPHIPWDRIPVRVVAESWNWPRTDRPRIAGVSSFGFTGTNAHVILEEAPEPSSPAAPAPVDPSRFMVLPLSGRTPAALAKTAENYRQWIHRHPEATLADVCLTAGTARTHFEHRAALVANSLESARELLGALADDRPAPGLVRGDCVDAPKTAWLFGGQGSQYPGMARELFDREPVFAATMTRCADAVADILQRPLLEVIFDPDSHPDAAETLQQTRHAQPAIYAVEMGLAALWQSWGFEPDVVLGHSVGQYAAAGVAGVFSLEDGARLIAERGRLFGSLPTGGRMVAVFADPEYVLAAAEKFPRVSVAAYNGRNTVLSGPGDDLEQIVAVCSDDGTRCTWLETSHAFHSELLDPVLDEFESIAAQFDYAAPTRSLICNRTGSVITAGTPLDAPYWRRHSRQPVQFTESVRTAASLGCSVVMEIGPQPVLTAAALQIWPESSPAPRVIASLRKGTDARRQITEAVASAYVSGHRPDFAAIQHGPSRRIELPTYPFQRRRYWPKTSVVTIAGSDGLRVSGILGSAKDLASGDTVYTTVLSARTQPWLADHVIYGTVVVPGATYATMALAAAGVPARVREVFFYEPIILPEKASREVQLTMHPLETGAGWKFQVHSRPHGVPDTEWSLNADGSVLTGADTDLDTVGPAGVVPIDEAVERLDRISPQRLFETFNDMELAWGPTWSGSLKSLWVGDGEAIGDVCVGDELAEHLGSEPIHPVLLDLCTGVAFPAFPALLAAEHGVADLFLPLRYGQVEVREQMPRRFYCRARWHGGGIDSETQVFDLDFVDRGGGRLGGISEFTVKRAPREALLRGLGGDTTRLLYTVGWHESTPPGDPGQSRTNSEGTWLIAGFDELAAELPAAVVCDPAADPQVWHRAFADAAAAGAPVAGVLWRSSGASRTDESADRLTERLDAEVAGLLAVVQAALTEGTSSLTGGLWIITERAVTTEPGEPVDPVQAALWGFGRTVIAEQPTLRCRLVDSDGTEESLGWLAAALGVPLVEPELAVRQGKFLVPRLLHWARSGQLPMPRTDDYVLAPTERGAIDNLRLTQTEVAPPAANEVQVRMEAAGLNFRDVLNVLGLYPGDPGPIGGDLCGIVTEVGSEVTGFTVGQRVMGFMQGAFASRVNVPALLLAPVPDGVDAVGAATIPAAALTARLAFDWAKLKSGDRVLIHAASGGVGLAAIQLARHHGAIVFATASAYKRATLRELGVDYVYDSRTTDFADQILADTDGAGVDVVLNSLTNEGFVEATVRATATGGRFAEIAKRDIWSPERMAAARPDIDYGIVALDATTLTDPGHIQRLMMEVSEGLAEGEWTPVPAAIYPLTEARAAFRRMQQARHIGKVVVQMPEPLHPRGDRSYLITGGLGALGLHTAQYLAQLGAGDIVLTSRGLPDGDTARSIAAITERFHCRVHVFPADIGNGAEVDRLLGRIRAELPPLGGVAHLAGVLDDALLPDQNPERFRTTARPKALGAYHLHRLTEDDDLEFFILFSSASAVLGSPAQANYAAANALLDGLAAHRRARGLPATAVDFGPWGRGGMASSAAARANLGAQGMLPLDPTAALAALGEVIRHGTAQATVLKASWPRAAKMLGGLRPALLDQVLPDADASAPGDGELLRQLREVPEAQRAGFITEFLQREVQGFLRLAQPPAASSRFLDLGTDSLMAVELRNRLFAQFGGRFDISPTAVFDYPTIRELAEHLVSQLPETDRPETGAPPPAASASDPVTEPAPAPTTRS